MSRAEFYATVSTETVQRFGAVRMPQRNGDK